MNNENNNTVKDFNRLTIETAMTLARSANKALKELQGDNTFEQAFNDRTFRDLLHISLMADHRMMVHERKIIKYESLRDFHKQFAELYRKMLMIYRYVSKGNEVPGIEWSRDNNNVFAITLSDCAVNMEHYVKDDDGEGTAYCVWLNVPLLATEDPDNVSSKLHGQYGKFVGFCCDMGNEHRDLKLDWTYLSQENLVLDTLAGLDVIADMYLEQSA